MYRMEQNTTSSITLLYLFKKITTEKAMHVLTGKCLKDISQSSPFLSRDGTARDSPTPTAQSHFFNTSPLKLCLQGLLVSAFILTSYKNVFCFIYPKVTPLASSACMCTVCIIQTQACNMYVTRTHNIHAHVAITQVFSLRTRCSRLSAREWTHKPNTFFL